LEVDADNRRLSLGHKQLEENPWDVFETVFTVGSLHKGTILSVTDKGGATVAMPYGLEAFCPKSQLMKEDKKTATVDEQLDFKIIEFSKEAKKIVVSHSKTWQKEETNPNRPMSEEKAIKKNNESLEKTTLGDIDALANLKEKMTKDANDKKSE